MQGRINIPLSRPPSPRRYSEGAATQRDLASDVGDSRVQTVLDRLNTDFNKPIRIPALARELGLSTSRMQHLFNSVTGQSIKAVLKQIRLSHALRLVASSQFSIKEICFAVGYC